jgi:ketosteroid isomerase-like protein
MATSATGQADKDLLQVLEGYAEAGNAHDIDGMMSFIAADCEFYSSTGPDASGTRYIGSEKIREGFVYFLEICPDGQWTNLRYFVSGDRGVMEWTFIGTTPAGGTIEENGCDLITFKCGKIAIKDSYRKNRPASRAN